MDERNLAKDDVANGQIWTFDKVPPPFLLLSSRIICIAHARTQLIRRGVVSKSWITFIWRFLLLYVMFYSTAATTAHLAASLSAGIEVQNKAHLHTRIKDTTSVSGINIHVSQKKTRGTQIWPGSLTGLCCSYVMSMTRIPKPSPEAQLYSVESICNNNNNQLSILSFSRACVSI